MRNWEKLNSAGRRDTEHLPSVHRKLKLCAITLPPKRHTIGMRAFKRSTWNSSKRAELNMIPDSYGEIRITMIVGTPSSVPAGTQQRMKLPGTARVRQSTTALVPGYCPLSLRDNRGILPLHTGMWHSPASYRSHDRPFEKNIVLRLGTSCPTLAIPPKKSSRSLHSFIPWGSHGKQFELMRFSNQKHRVQP
jgi:hypothetical protein